MAEEVEKTTEQTQEDKNEKLVKCPCCGELTLQRPLDIKSAVLDEYMASIISGVPFQHTYTLHNSLDITATVLSKAEKTKIYNTLQLLDTVSKTLGEADPTARTKVDELAAMIQLYCYIAEIQARKDKQIVAAFSPATKISELCDTINAMQLKIILYATSREDTGLIAELVSLYDNGCSEKALSAVPDVMLKAVARTHTDLYNILMSESFDANFWKGIELA